MKPLVSVIVPIYNVEKYIDRCLNSIINQKLEDIEIILVDDGSPDNCPQICENYRKKDNRIKVIHKENEGLGYARNSGMKIANGKYISFIDSDDYISEEFLYNLYTKAIEYDADACLGGNTSVSGDKIIEYKHLFSGNVLIGDEIKSKLLLSMLGYDEMGSGYTGMSVWRGIYKKGILDKFEILFPSERKYISEDIIFDITFFAKANKVVISDNVGYFYCYNGDSLTTTYKEDRFEKYKILYNYERELIKNFENNYLYEQRITSMFLANIRVTLMQEARFCSLNKEHSKKKSISNIINDETTQKAISSYNWKKLPGKQRVFCFFIKHKNWRMVYWLAYFQIKSKH